MSHSDNPTRARIVIEVDVTGFSRDLLNECAVKLGLATQSLGEVVFISTEVVDPESQTLKKRKNR
jgi:hypothetical protein